MSSMRKPALMAPAIAALVTAMTMTPALAQDMTVTPGNTLTAAPPPGWARCRISS